VIAALALAARAPFIFRADRFFDSDEAVEGLMARHVLTGEWPIFLWGQRYKGVPEVYLTSVLFRLAEPSPWVLKLSTACVFALFVALQFLLIKRLFSARIAWLAAALTIGSTPAAVLWSLSASAEIVWTLLAGAVFGLALERWRGSGSTTAIAVAAVAVGFALWVQQYIVYYLVALVVTMAITLPAPRRQQIQTFLRAQRMPPWLRAVLLTTAGVGVLYAFLGVLAFVGAGFDLPVSTVAIAVHHPQKLWRIAAAAWALTAAMFFVVWITGATEDRRRQALIAAAMFIVGYSPALIGLSKPPIARMDLSDTVAASHSIATLVLPVLAGLRSPGMEWLLPEGWGTIVALLIGSVAVVSFIPAARSRAMPFFHVFVVTTPLVFLLSGTYVDAQSYRYLMPLYAAVPVVLAIGIDALARRSAVTGATALIALVMSFAAENYSWYERLQPDSISPAILACLERDGTRAGFADYWLSYKLTFLSAERIIIAPTTGVDRYPPYTDYARLQHHAAATITLPEGTRVWSCR
jgi:hypothetical protein